MLIGLAAGSIAAIVVALVSLPLNSPVDNVFNSATAGLASLIVGIVAGWLWVRSAANPRRVVYYVAVLVAGLVAAVVLAVVGNIWLERLISFAVPLAAIAFVLSGALVPLLERTPPTALRWAAPVFVIAAVALGGGLVGQGDAESGELSLPERVAAPAAPPAATSAPEPTSMVEPTPVPSGPMNTLAPTSGVAPTPVSSGPANTPEPASTTTPTTALATAATTVPDTAVTEDPETSASSYVVGDGSEITFTVGEKLTRLPLPIEAVIRTGELSGQINLDGQPSAIEVNLHSLASDQNFRDQYIRSRMFPEHPVATFTVDSITGLPEEFLAGDPFEYQVDGTLTINGIDVPIAFDLEVRKDEDVLNVVGRTVFTWEQLQIPVPTARSVVYVEDEVRVEVLLIAKP